MIVASPDPIRSEHVVLYDVSWNTYERLLEAIGDRRLRHSYDQGALEIISPLKRHDAAKSLLGRLIEAAALEWDIDIESLGSTTLRKEPASKGLEPDECYYVAHSDQTRRYDDYDPNRDPPPDLAVEVDMFNSSIDRLAIYAAIGVPEVWRLQDGRLQFYRLSRKKYLPIKSSLSFPGLVSEVVEQLVHKQRTTQENAIVREFIAWLRKHRPAK